MSLDALSVSLVCLIAFTPMCAVGQSSEGTIRGRIQDEVGGGVPNAALSLTSRATNLSRSTTTNRWGEYAFSALDPGAYALAVVAPGFKTLERPNVVVSTAATVALDLQMELGPVSERVEMRAETPLIDTSDASNGQTEGTRRIEDLPNLGRNVFLLGGLTTNVAPVGDPRWTRLNDQADSSQISIAGGPVRGNNYLIDGIPVTDSVNRPIVIPSLEAMQEMKLQTGTYDATVGRTGGGVFNALLRSGGNDFHGDAIGYLRQTGWAANNFFNNAAGIGRQPMDWRTWAGGLGGPLWIPGIYNGRNKTFFYVATESYRQDLSYSDEYALPTALEREGHFSQSSTPIFDWETSQACVASDKCPAGASVVRIPFPGNIIPPSRINPVGVAILSYLPLPQVAAPTDSFNYTGASSVFDRADEYIAKLDHSFAEWFRVTASYIHFKSRDSGGNTLGTLPGASSENPYVLYRKVDATAVHAVLVPNPTTVATFRFGFNRFPNVISEASAGFNPASLGFPASFAGALESRYFPTINLLNNSISGQSLVMPPQWAVFWSRNALASFSKIVGRHSMTFGVDYRLIHADFLNLSNTAGSFSFNGVFSSQYPNVNNGSGADFADLLMGVPSNGSVSTTVKLFDYINYYAGYIQDDIRLSGRLTVNLGLRYEYETGIAENNNHLVVGFDQTASNPLAANVTGIAVPGVIQFAGVDGNPASCCSPRTAKFGPRAGAAWRVAPNTVLRGGWGIFYAPFAFNSNASTAPGYSQSTTYVASNDGNATPANSLSNPFPEGIQQPSGNSLGALTAVGSSFNFFDQHASSGIVQQFSVDLQYELGSAVALDLGYLGSRSSGLQQYPTNPAPTLDINQVPVGDLTLGSALAAAVPNPFYGHGGSGIIGAPTVSEAQLLMPFPEYGTIGMITNPSHAKYDSLILKAQRRFSAGLAFLSAITWSKNMDNEFGNAGSNALNGFSGSSPPSQPQNRYDLNAEWSLASVNAPIRLTFSWLYDLPFGKGKRFLNIGHAAALASGWQINGTSTYQMGFPLFIYQQDLNALIGAGAQRPNATGESPATSGSLEDRLNGYINPAAFSLAGAFTFGNLTRSIGYRGPGEANWDISIFRSIPLRERLTAQLRVEALNAFNTPLFANPNTQYGTASFGKITNQANLPRQIQLGLRLSF